MGALLDEALAAAEPDNLFRLGFQARTQLLKLRCRAMYLADRRLARLPCPLGTSGRTDQTST